MPENIFLSCIRADAEYRKLLTALRAPVPRLLGRIVAIDRHVVRAPLPETHALAVLEIDRR